MSRAMVPPVRFPRPLKKGSRVRCIAPSGPYDETALQAGISRLAPYLSFELSPELGEKRQGFLAASDEQRHRDLMDAYEDDTVDAVWVVRGGYGLGRLPAALHHLRTASGREKLWIGFSDATVLHQALFAAGQISLHGPNLTTVGKLHEDDFQHLLSCLFQEVPAPPQTLVPLIPPTNPGVLGGPLVGGNLTVLFSEAASGRLSFPENALLFLEDVSETSYRVDRMLTALEAGGHLRVAGIVLGDFTDCSPGRFEVPVEEVLKERLSRLGCPIFGGFPSGHGARHRSFFHGAWTQIEERPSGFLLWQGARGSAPALP